MRLLPAVADVSSFEDDEVEAIIDWPDDLLRMADVHLDLLRKVVERLLD